MKIKKYAAQSTAEFIALLIIMSVIGYGVYNKIDELLIKALEESVAQQSESIANGLKNQLEEELKKLRATAKSAENGIIKYEELPEVIRFNEQGETMGIIKESGELIAGNTLEPETMELLKNVFKGEEEIKYRTEFGLIFAIPIKIENENCLYYDCYDTVMLITFMIILIALILGVRYMMRTRESKNLEREKELADSSKNLQSAAKSLLGLVNDILDFSKIEAGKMEIIPVEYKLSRLLTDLVNMIETRAEKKGLELKTEVNENLPSELFGDEIRIKQIITNLLTNAVKYTEKGKVILKIDGEKISDEKIKLCVSVSDTGIGIKEEDIEKLFSAFERIEEKRNRTIEGTGLGMNITQKFLNLMNSEIKVKSEYGKGSTFSFELEQKIINAEPIGNFHENYKKSLANQKEYREKFTAPDAKILVVDDTPMNLTVVKGLLKPMKIQIDVCESGLKCLEMVKKNKYDAIFLDHRMPEPDGIETYNMMKAQRENKNQETPIIALTANAISGAREMFLAEGFNDYLSKPIDSNELEKMLIKYLPSEKIKKATEQEKEEIKIPEEIKNLKGLDIKFGIEHCGGVEEYEQALKIYANSIENGSTEIEKFFEVEDWKNYTTKVHALKSSSKIIGATKLSELARELEDAGNLNDTDKIKKDTKKLLELYRSYEEILRGLIKKEKFETDENKPPIEEEELQEALEAMKEFTKSFDYDSLMFIIQSLEEYKLPEEETKRLKDVKAAAEKLNWEELEKKLNE